MLKDIVKNVRSIQSGRDAASASATTAVKPIPFHIPSILPYRVTAINADSPVDGFNLHNMKGFRDVNTACMIDGVSWDIVRYFRGYHTPRVKHVHTNH